MTEFVPLVLGRYSCFLGLNVKPLRHVRIRVSGDSVQGPLDLGVRFMVSRLWDVDVQAL